MQQCASHSTGQSAGVGTRKSHAGKHPLLSMARTPMALLCTRCNFANTADLN